MSWLGEMGQPQLAIKKELSGLPRWLSVKNPPASAGDVASVPGSGRSPGEGSGSPLQHACPGGHTDRGAWQAVVHGVTKSRT